VCVCVHVLYVCVRVYIRIYVLVGVGTEENHENLKVYGVPESIYDLCNSRM
jgi:hypothetical protein